MVKRLLAALIFILIAPQISFAQNTEDQRKGQTYMKFSFNHMSHIVEDYRITIPGLGVEVEKEFEKDHLLLSAFSFGYRRERSYDLESGNFLNFKVARHEKVGKLTLAMRGGIEWGRPSAIQDFTIPLSDLRYTYVLQSRNSDIPFLKPTKDATLSPLAELSIRSGNRFIFIEGGVRINFLRFKIDEYDIPENSFRSRTTFQPAPSIFLTLGLGT